MRQTNTPTSIQDAFRIIDRLEEQVKQLMVSIEYELLPAWVIQDILDENAELKQRLRDCGIDTQ